jgi:nitrous oxidase accessory protein NosD
MIRSLGLKAARVVIFAVAALLMTVTSATAAHVQCGDVITQDTTLDSDLACTGDGLTVTGSNVTLHLNGHTIQGSGGFTTGVGIFDAVDPEVRGGTIRGFSLGVNADGPRRPLVGHMVLEHNDFGFHCNYTSGCRIKDSVARQNGTGVLMVSADAAQPEAGLVSRNLLERNNTGLRLSGYPATVSGNRVLENLEDGVSIDYYGDADVTNNLIARNGSNGVGVYYLGHATIDGNRIEANAADGVLIDGGGEFGVTRALVGHNRADRNGDDGIDVEDGEHSVIVGNRTFFNTDLGIEAGPRTTDGGGNKAKHNGNPVQCVGVSCR